MVLEEGDWVTVKAYKPPPVHIVTWKKRLHEALAELAQHQFRGSGHMKEEQRECMMRCMAHARRVHREVAQSIYGPSFQEVSRFLDGARRRRSVWRRARAGLEAMDRMEEDDGDDDEASRASDLSSVASSRSAASSRRSATGGDTEDEEEEDDADMDDEEDAFLAGELRGLFASEPPGLSSLLPCAVVYPNMHPTDRPELLKFLLAAVQQRAYGQGADKEEGERRRRRKRAKPSGGGESSGDESSRGPGGAASDRDDEQSGSESDGSRMSVVSASSLRGKRQEPSSSRRRRQPASSRVPGQLPPIGVVIRSGQHPTLASILRAVCQEIHAAVDGVAAKARAQAGLGGARHHHPHQQQSAGQQPSGRGGGRGLGPQGTLGEVMAAYNTLLDGLTALYSSTSQGGAGADKGGRRGRGKGRRGAKDKEQAAAAAAAAGFKLRASQRPPLLLLFEDVEAVSNRLLEDLLRLLAEASAQLPARLVFLVSPAFSLAQNLGSAATAALEPATFLLPPAQAVFEALLDRLFLQGELPVMAAGRVLRFFRVTFLEHHHSITAFIRQLDFLLRVHFSQLPSLLCMLPYDLVPESLAPLIAADPRLYTSSSSSDNAAAAAAAAAALSQQSVDGTDSGGAGVGAAGAQPPPSVLVLTKEEGGMHDSHNLMVLRHLDALMANPNLRQLLTKLVASSSSSSATAAGAAASSAASSASGGDAASAAAAAPGGGGAGALALSEDHSRQFQCLRILVNQQLAARFELRLGCHLIRQVLLSTATPSSSSSCPEVLHLAELLLDHERPQRWQALEHRLFDRLGATSLQDLEGLVGAWLDILRTLVEPMPLRVRRFSKAINSWIARARELWLLLKALAKEMMGGGKKKKKGKKPREATDENTAGGNAGGDGQSQGQGQSQDAGSKAPPSEEVVDEAAAEEARRLYRIKSQGIAMDAQALLAEVVGHCRGVGQAGGYARDAFWYRDTQTHQDVFFAQPRASAVKALTDSQSYLQCACCPEGGGGGLLHPSMPDVCLVYGLYEAHQGRVLNLRAWFAAFVDAICGEDEEEEEEVAAAAAAAGAEEEEQQSSGKGKGKGKGRGRKKSSTAAAKAGGGAGGAGPTIPPQQLKALWARFLHAVDELEHLGFTRPYGKKGRGDRAKLLFAYTLLGDSGGGGGGGGGSSEGARSGHGPA